MKRTLAVACRQSLLRQHIPVSATQPLSFNYILPYRDFSSSSKNHRSKRLKKKVDNPFAVLGVKEDDTFSVAKKSFLQIAMKNHPDTANVETEEEKDQLRDVFIQARMAFESLVEAPDGTILLQEEVADSQDFDEWFKDETGHDMPFQFDMDPATMREVAKMTEEVGGVGLDRDGGMWTLAKMVANQVKNGGNAESILRLDQGNIKKRNTHINGKLRRKRR